jgi:ribosome-binding factor A
MLAGKRAIRVGDQILREIAVILLERVKDPRVQDITATGIRMSDDLRFARIYYSVMGEKDRIKRAQAGLDRAKGFIKREIGRRMELRYVPEIIFIHDSSLEMGTHMDNLLDKLKADGPTTGSE